MRRCGFAWCFFLALAAQALSGETWIRWNQAGYRSDWPKRVIVMADGDLNGQNWRLVTGTAEEVVLTGTLGPSAFGRGSHSPFPYHHVIDVTAVRQPGEYRLVVGAEEATLQVREQPYLRLIDQALQHLRMVRSGSDDVPGRRLSHAGDAHAALWVPDGDPAEGKWKPAVSARTVDVRGGWYDAGDQIKFTLNEAYTTYVLLLAYELAVDRLDAAADPDGEPAILQEARHGLAFLERVFPDEQTFIIQVGDERDHNQPWRLPEDDALDGQRPALSALSRVHMGAAAAALAKGAQVFRERGRTDDAVRWGDLARRIFARAQGPDVVRTAFERGKVNDFYHDPSDEDQQALAAVELFELTGEQPFLETAIALAPIAASEVSWADWHSLANGALARHDAAARDRLLAETAKYVAHAEEQGGPWRIPGRYVWASLHRWLGAAHACGRAAHVLGGDTRREAVMQAMVDYTFGVSNWGCSFLFSQDLPNTLRHLYSPMYQLLDRFPTGALSEGPGNRSTHETLQTYFEAAQRAHELPIDRELPRFNTAAAVFADNAYDFMCQEATIVGQADVILVLALASMR